MGKADLPQELVTFSAGFPICSQGKLAGRIANGNQVIVGGWVVLQLVINISPLPSTLITIM